MLTVSDTLKTIYRNDQFPYVTQLASKELELYFPALDLTIATDQIVDDGFELTESICSGSDLVFGSCEADQIKLTLADVVQDLTGLEFMINQIVNEAYTMPLGIFKVDTCTKQDDLRFKDIVGYSRMRKTDVDVSSWYNGLFPIGTETYTLAAFRASLLTHLGLTEDTANLPLPNDSMTVSKTIEPSEISGRVVLSACEEVNGAFGHIGRDGKFKHVVLHEMHEDYPTDDYPGIDYPINEPYDEYISSSQYREIKFEEYTVSPIDKLQIRQEENDIGCIVGTGTNAYIIQGNFLVYGKDAIELEVIANNAASNIFKRGYRPYTASNIGLPYLEVGDFIKYNADDTTAGYIFERILTGIQALQDGYAAQGSEEREQNFGVNNEIIQLLGKTAKITKNVNEITVTLGDEESGLIGEVRTIAGQVVLKVDTDGNIGYVELTGDPDTDLTSIVLKADNINLNGYVGINNYVIVTEDGKLHAVDGEFSGSLTASEFIGGYVRSSNYYSGVSGMMIDLNNSTIDMINLYVDPTGKIKSTNGEIITSGASGSVTIKDGKITLKNTSLVATAEIDGSDMWIDYIVINETANFLGTVNFQLDSAPSLTVGGASQTFVTSANISSYLSGYATDSELISGMNTVDSTLRAWVTANFVHV